MQNNEGIVYLELTVLIMSPVYCAHVMESYSIFNQVLSTL